MKANTAVMGGEKGGQHAISQAQIERKIWRSSKKKLPPQIAKAKSHFILLSNYLSKPLFPAERLSLRQVVRNVRGSG